MLIIRYLQIKKINNVIRFSIYFIAITISIITIYIYNCCDTLLYEMVCNEI